MKRAKHVPGPGGIAPDCADIVVDVGKFGDALLTCPVSVTLWRSQLSSVSDPGGNPINWIVRLVNACTGIGVVGVTFDVFVDNGLQTTPGCCFAQD